MIRHLKDHFIPHKGNNHHPKILHHRVLVAYSVGLILLKAAAIVVAIALPSSTVFSSSITADNVIQLTNATRHDLELPTLVQNDQLTRAAQLKADDMLAKQYFAHTSPSGANALTWIGSTGYDALYAGENLAVHFFTAEDVQNGWLASPTHRANIVNPVYTQIGVGISHGQFEGADSMFVVQLFGRPVDQPPAIGKAVAIAATSIKTKLALAAPKKAAPILAPAPQHSPVIDESSVKIHPQAKNFQVTLNAPTAKSVQVDVGSASANLTASSTTGTWVGSIALDPHTVSTNGEQLNATVVDQAGSTQRVPLALLAPLAQVQDVYQFTNSAPKDVTLFTVFHLGNIDDSVHRFYLYFIIFLATALMLSVVVKIKKQHPSVIVHTLGVLGLAVLLWWM